GISEKPCLYCGNTSFELWARGIKDRLRFVSGQRDWLKCRHCGSLILSPFPLRDEISGFYPPVYTFQADRDRASAIGNFIAQLEYHVFFRMQYQLQSQRVMGMTRLTEMRPRMLDVG